MSSLQIKKKHFFSCDIFDSSLIWSERLSDNKSSSFSETIEKCIRTQNYLRGSYRRIPPRCTKNRWLDPMVLLLPTRRGSVLRWTYLQVECHVRQRSVCHSTFVLFTIADLNNTNRRRINYALIYTYGYFWSRRARKYTDPPTFALWWPVRRPSAAIDNVRYRKSPNDES